MGLVCYHLSLCSDNLTVAEETWMLKRGQKHIVTASSRTGV